jgi:hypothetical protein
MIKEVNIKDTPELIENFFSFPNNYLYRGHADSDWKLESTLERLLKNRWTASDVTQAASYADKHFRSQFRIYNKTEHVPESGLQWLAMKQHYGIPTHALDVTSSPLIALYFALESFSFSSEKNFAVFAIDSKAIMEHAIGILKGRGYPVPATINEIYGKQDQIYEDHISKTNLDLLWIAEPDILNDRIDRQRGGFIIAGDQTKKIEDILKVCGFHEPPIQKLIIPSNCATTCLDVLRKCGISAKTIYGDLAGLTTSIKMELGAYMDSH